ncbi:MAG: tRNA adenosine(34) deaminase TadA [Planctomycetes bacterium]|nr:tRNA adenosine(34) deaminase TadA [Planctomycetota bacterium]
MTGEVTSSDERWIARCLELARAAEAAGEVPVGAVVVVDGVALGEGRNRVEERRSPLAHAELLALEQAIAVAGEKRLPAAELYCSLEPCFLCAGAALHARVRRVVFGARDPKFGAVRSLARLLEDPRLNHRAEVVEGLGAETSAELLRAFFRARRSG